MTSVKQLSAKSLSYPRKTIQRAERSLRCSPFQMPLFVKMRSRSVDFQEIVGVAGEKLQYTRRPLSELATENALLWLIEVGVLRREVDGQGITNSFRLTPLGHQIIEQWQNRGGMIPPASLSDRIYNALNRWFRLPF
ncbi:hypothetical protein H6S82_07900 [Planktothrix sp. FACHB-1355]|uniref:Uncharacterized protein n=1 Tax=Aerosakkonema funiforme FACHB-1375 TaxID=2949571 RepID=A0A926VEH1_9CYAN|nr:MULTISPECIES: Npun_F0494 family protein [Oscillatoriales]MBD2181452.1 hypothetical protein [Aerosakkonema funiforme FACHB-1375]MBD3558778.1 hypothetical protein [Planktothrix sp. FACHB-1355]